MELPALVPAFRQLVQVLEECLQTGSPLYCIAKELKETDVALGERLARFEAEATCQDLTLDEDDAVADAYETFHLLREDLTALRAAMADEDREGARAVTDRTAQHLRGLEDAFGRLVTLERQRPKLSPVPAVDGLLRVGHAVAEERLGFEALAGRLEPVLATWERTAEGLARLRSPLLGPVQAHGAALEDLRAVVETEDRDSLLVVLEAVRATAETLATAPADEEPTAALPCPLCGTALGPQDTRCGACGGLRPWEAAEAPDVPDHVQRLLDAGQRLRDGEGSWPEFSAAVAEVRRRAEAALVLLERVTPPRPSTPADELETWHAAQAAVEDGLEKFFEALGHLEGLARQPEEWVLDLGLEGVLAAVEETRRVSGVWQDFVESRNS